MAQDLIGVSIDDNVHGQITAREKIHGKLTRSKLDLEYLNSNNLWILLRSSVNTHNQSAGLLNKTVLKKNVKGSSSKAKAFELAGGALNEGNARAGVGFSSSTAGGNTAYHNSSVRGFVPMAGITGASVKSKNTFGTLKETEVQFKVFSKEDLDTAETLYFRVGFGALVEYGHTVYCDNKGNVKSYSKGDIVESSTWYGGSNEAVVNAINGIKKRTFGNYDGIFGYITNFNWSLGADGSYDCSVKIISKGVILESIQASAVSDHANAEEQKNEEEEQSLEEAKSIEHYIGERIGKAGQAKPKEVIGIKTLLEEAKAPNIAAQMERNWPCGGYKASVGTGNYVVTRWFYNDSLFLQYMPLGALLDILNEFEMMRDDKGKIICRFETNSRNRYVTFPGHFSCEPLVAFPPKVPTGEYSFCEIAPNEGANKLQANLRAAIGNPSLCTSIMVSTYVIRSQMAELVEQPSEAGTGIFEFLKSILTQINHALGGINNLDLFYDDGTHTYTVFDRGMPDSPRNPSKINISGLKSTITDINVTSKISSEMASMVSIAAQGNTGTYNGDFTSFVKFNEGVVDRHNLSKDQGGNNDGGNTEAQEAEKKKPFKERFQEVWEEANNKEILNTDTWSQLYNEASSELKRQHQVHKTKNSSGGGFPIPIELSITMKGLSGFKIGSSFKVSSGVIPSKYEKFIYFITAVDHELGSDGWKTTVGAKMMVP